MVFESQKVESKFLIQTVANYQGFTKGLIMLVTNLVQRCYNFNSFISNYAKFSKLTLGVMCKAFVHYENKININKLYQSMFNFSLSSFDFSLGLEISRSSCSSKTKKLEVKYLVLFGLKFYFIRKCK